MQRQLLDAQASKQLKVAEEEDTKLAEVAAAATVLAQPRLFPSNGIVIAVVGCGRMGVDIVGELLRRGCTVRMYDVSEAARARAVLMVAALLQKLHERRLLLPGDAEALATRCSVAASPAQLVVGARCVIEAVPEDLRVKRALMQELAGACFAQRVPSGSILFLTNTLSLPLDQLVMSMDTAYRSRVVGARFLAPVWFVDEVMVTPASATAGWMGAAACVAASSATQELLRALSFQPSVHLAVAHGGSPPRLITYEESALYAIRQKTRCEMDQMSMTAAQLAEQQDAARLPLASADTAQRWSCPPHSYAEQTEPCAVCDVLARDAVVAPCGHVAMCTYCALTLSQNGGTCTVCNGPIEEVLPITMAAADDDAAPMEDVAPAITMAAAADADDTPECSQSTVVHSLLR